MKINHNKSGIMIIKKNAMVRKQFEKQTEKTIKQFPIVETYKFLGVIMNRNNTMEEHLDNLKRKSNYLISRICWIPNTAASVKDKLILWRSLIRPIITYGNLIMQHMK